MIIKPTELHSFVVYDRQVHHEIGSLNGKEFHRFTIDPCTYMTYTSEWSNDENGAFAKVLKRIGKSHLALIKSGDL